MGVTTVIKAIERFLERRPWCIAGVYLLLDEQHRVRIEE